MLEGWICPKCGKVYSPYIAECDFCNDYDECEHEEPDMVIRVSLGETEEEKHDEEESNDSNLSLEGICELLKHLV